MKKLVLYVALCAGEFLLYQWSEQLYGTEWLFALAIVLLFILFLLGWKRYSSNGVGLMFITAYTLLTINSIFYLIQPSIYTISYSLLLGLTLAPLYRKYRDAVVTTWLFTLSNILINIEVGNEITFFLLFFTTGIGGLVGYYCELVLVKRCFTIIFFINAFIMIVMNLLTEAFVYSLVLAVLVVVFALFAYRFSQGK